MKKLLLFVLAALVLLTGCNNKSKTIDNQSDTQSLEETAVTTISSENETQTSEDITFDFRNVNWGATKEEVIKSENQLGEPNSVEDDSVYYKDVTILENTKSSLIYLFVDDKLVGAMYGCQIEHASENMYIDDYEQLKSALTSKYGAVYKEEIKWLRDLYKDDPDKYGFAVGIGDLSYISCWKTDTSIIGLSLKGDNYQLNINIIYRDKNFKEQVPNTDGL